jgi:hypothetical protein
MYIIIFCYILIIPGFGIISHVIGTMSDKSVFGQYGPKSRYKINNYVYFSQRTICKKLADINLLISKVQNTLNVSNKTYSFQVKIFVYFNNPQITKARIILLSRFKIIYFFELSMLVGISEAIRLLLTYFFITLKNKLNLFFQIKRRLSFINIRETNYFSTNIKNAGFHGLALTLGKTNINSDKKDEDSFNE